MGKKLKSAKSGRVINPADVERKAARRRELKKNKKQRGLVRSAVLKSKDADDIIIQMQKLDLMQFNLEIPCPLADRVVDEKRQKLRDTYDKILAMYHREDEERYDEVKQKLEQYDMIRKEMESNFTAQKFAKEANPSEIPLPDGLAAPGAEQTPLIPEPEPSLPQGPFPSHLILPKEPGHGILKKGKKKVMELGEPPGVPVGPPPRFSDSESSGDEEDEESDPDEERVSRPRDKQKEGRVRFADERSGDEGEGDDYEDIDGEPTEDIPIPLIPHPVRGGGPLFPSSGARLLRPPPPPPGMPPRLLMPGRMPAPVPPSGAVPRNPINPPPPRPPGGQNQFVNPASLLSTGAVIQAGPTLNKTAGPVIEGKPQLRNMQKEVVKLVPTALKVRREGEMKKKSKSTQPLGAPSAQAPSGLSEQKNKDDAYDQFMSELSGLL